MSLVNKVLRDLDARRAGEGERAALPAAVTPLASRLDRSTRWPLVALGILAMAGAIGLGTFLLQGGFPNEKPVDSPRPAAAAAPVPPAAPAPVPPSTPAPVPPTASAAAPANVPTPVAAATDSLPPREEPGIAGVSSLRLSDALQRLPEPRKPPPSAPTSMNPASKPASKPAQARPAPPAAVEPVAAMPRPAPADDPAAIGRGARTPEPAAEMRVEKQERKPTPAESAEASYRRGVAAQRQGNAAQAASFHRQALDLHPEHAAARQALAGLLLEARQFDEADELLRRGIDIPSARVASVLTLARLKVEKGDAASALDLLLRNAGAGERSADYQGFLGALLNRAGRSGEAIERYQSATRLAPSEARWWAGLGISLDAGGRAAEAREAYLKARGLPGLPADLAQYVEQRLR